MQNVRVTVAAHYKVCKTVRPTMASHYKECKWLDQLSLPNTRYEKLLYQLWLPSTHHKTYSRYWQTIRQSHKSQSVQNYSRMPGHYVFSMNIRLLYSSKGITTGDFEKKINKSDYENFFLILYILYEYEIVS
jgi:hypothetical protein